MGNSFCKADNAFLAKDKRLFVSCMTDHGLGTKTSDTTWVGKCMYHDEAKVKALLEKSQATKHEPSSEEQRSVYVDTGLTCKVTATSNGPVVTTDAAPVPTGYLRATAKPTAKPEDVSAFEARYTEFLLDAHMQNKLPQFDEQIADMFNFQVPPPSVKPTYVAASAPPVPSPVVSSWTPSNIAIVSILGFLAILSLVVVVRWIMEAMKQSTPPTLLGGRKRI